jgi:hypothetical protein
MSEKKMNEKFKVIVDDNYHHADESDRYTVGSYASLEEALDKCKEITVKSLKHFYEKGITPEKLSAQWAMFGEDPYIFTGKGSVPFSARKFVSSELCKEIIDSIDNVIAKPEA